MANQILESLKSAVSSRTGTWISNAEVLRNAAKEEIQYYVLNFIYHHPIYSQWTMYGGSALRICYNLNRMSVDLDFEINQDCTHSLLDTLKSDVERYFLDKYGLEEDMLTIKIMNGRGLLLRFSIGNEFGINSHSKQVHVKIDLNNFVPPKAVMARIPINHIQLSFVIKTYNMSTLMASKIAAILLRGTRRVGKEAYEEKGRDIYDLLWYMERKITPDLNYLRARIKNSGLMDLRELFAKLTLQMNKVSNQNLKDDLSPLFLDQNYIEDWLKQWYESYMYLVDSYQIRMITGLQRIFVRQDFDSDNYWFEYVYDTEDENRPLKIIYTISNYWFEDSEGKIPTKTDNRINQLLMTTTKGLVKTAAQRDTYETYASIFYNKNTAYLGNLNNIVIGSTIQTKIICLTPGAPNLKTIILNRSELLACTLEDLMS